MLWAMTATAPGPRRPAVGAGAKHVLRNPGVLGIGLGSLLSDTGHEMATAALPGFLRSLGAPAAALVPSRVWPMPRCRRPSWPAG